MNALLPVVAGRGLAYHKCIEWDFFSFSKKSHVMSPFARKIKDLLE